MRAIHTKSLDAVRAISALTVFLSHIIQIVWLPLVGIGSLVHVVNSFVSETAVIVFFVLSGYLISLSIHRNIENNGGFVAFDYLRSRFLRIYPPLVGAVVLSLSVWGLLEVFELPGIATPLRAASDLYAAREAISITMADVYHALTTRGGMLIVNGPLWSLYIEIRLYVAAGVAAIAFTYCPARSWKIAAAMAGFALVSFVIGQNQPGYLLYAAWWLLGSLFFFWRRFGYRIEGLAAGLVLSGVIVAASTTPILHELARIAFIVALSLLMFSRWSDAPKIFVRIGAFSYTLYLFHFPLLIGAYSLFVFACGGNAPSVGSRTGLTVASAIVVLAFSAAAGAVLEDVRRLGGLLHFRFSQPKRACL